ncbi:MAG: archaeosortase/exosortase family protein, partial [Candidatus Micrarchaeaceae archaeon]
MKEKTIGIIILLVAFFIGSFNVLYRTSFVIQDNDPTTYVVVVMLMLFVMLAFGIKENLALTYRRKDAILGVLALIAYILIVSYVRLLMSFVFYTYRIDALLLPLLLIGIILVIFGTDGVKKLKKQLVYSIFASPVVLLPIIEENTGFVNSVAYLTYWLMKVVGEPVTKSGLTIIAPSSYTISIAATCADLGAFIAVVMFLAPIAYFYIGSRMRKFYWVVSGVLLFFAFNMIRVFSIASIWVYYGIDRAVALFHMFAGQLLFYLAIIIMILIASRFDLHIWIGQIPQRTKRVYEVKSKQKKVRFYPNLSMALAIGLLGLAITLPYQNAIYAPLILLNTTQSVSVLTLYRSVGLPLENAEMNLSILEATNSSAILALSNQTYNRTNPIYVIAKLEGRAVQYGMLANYSSASGRSALVLSNGITINSAVIISGGRRFYINYFLFPYRQPNGNWNVVGYEMFYVLNSTA